jgi:hypothetical protein
LWKNLIINNNMFVVKNLFVFAECAKGVYEHRMS